MGRERWGVSGSFCSEIWSLKTNPAMLLRTLRRGQRKHSSNFMGSLSMHIEPRVGGRVTHEGRAWHLSWGLTEQQAAAVWQHCVPPGTQSWASFWGRVSLTVTSRHGDGGRLLKTIKTFGLIFTANYTSWFLLQMLYGSITLLLYTRNSFSIHSQDFP